MTSSLASPIARPPLEPVTAAFAATLDGPPPYELSLEQARAGLPALQAAAGAQRPPALIEDRVIPGGPTGEVAIRIVRPLGLATPAPVVVYGHGGGWVFGDPGTHDRVVRELAVAAHAALVFVDYTRAPEARHPVQVRQGEILLAWIAEHGAMAGLDPGRVAVAGDSSGANLATVWAMLSRDRPGIDLAAQSCSSRPSTPASTAAPTGSSPPGPTSTSPPCAGSGTTTSPTSVAAWTPPPAPCEPRSTRCVASRRRS